MKFSILVPVYNVEKYLQECIQSALAQTYENYELILVDDGSTDSSGSICDAYSTKYPKIVKVYHKPNQGLIHTRRFAIERAHGDCYIFLDSDDYLKPDALETVYRTFQKYNCDSVIFGFERLENNTVVSLTYDKEPVCLNQKRDIYRKCFFENDKNAICRKAVKATVFQGEDYSPYFHLQLGEDLLQSLEIYKNSQSIAFIPDILYVYRSNPASLTHQKSINIDFTIRKRTLSFLQSENVFTEDDFNEYRDFCIRLFAQMIWNILLSDKNQIDQRLSLMRTDSYYTDFLNAGITDNSRVGKIAIIFKLFSHKHDVLLKLGANIYKVSRKNKSVR